MREQVADEVNVLLDREDHLALHARALRSGHHEEVREARHHEPEVGVRAVGPFALDVHAAVALDVDFAHRAGHGVEAGGKHDGVELVAGIGGLNPGGGDALDRRARGVDQRDVVAVERLVVVRVEDQALGADRVIGGAQQLGRPRVLDGLPDAVADELCRRLIRLFVQQQVVVGVEEADAAAGSPLGGVGGVALLGVASRALLVGGGWPAIPKGVP